MNTLFNSALTLTYNQLSTFADLDNFWNLFDTAFGTQYNRSGAEILRLQWLSGDFSQVPQIEILDSSLLGTANGAYASSTNKIYLSNTFVANATSADISRVLLEEIGHFVDAQINTLDSAGDEGAIFAALVQGESLDVNTLQALKGEDDTAIIEVDGKSVLVEQSSVTNPTYSWDTNFISSINSSPILDSVNTLGTDTTDQVFVQAGKSVYRFASNSGLLLNDPNIPNNNYSIELVFTFDETTGYRKIIDFSDLVSDAGLYVLNNTLRFYAETAAVGTLASGYNHIVLSRATNNTTTIYLNGSEVLSFNDTNGLADLSPNGDLYLFVDDTEISGEHSAGAVSFIGLYSSVLTASEVLARYNTFNNGISDLPSITLAVSPSSVTEDGTANLVYTFTRTGITTNALTVNYGITGTATSTDYTGATPGTGKTITFAAGANTATLTIDPTADTIVESNETVALTLATAPTYTVGTTTAVTGTITNDDFPIISVVATDSDAGETATGVTVNDGTFTLTRTGDLSQAITVNYTLSGSATNGTDYSSLSGTVNFAAGVSSATVTVTPTDDNIFEGTETAILTLATGAGYILGTTTSATVNIADNDLPSISLAVSPASVVEDGATNLVYTFTRTGSTANALAVSYTVSGNATFNTDYTQTGASTFTATTGTITFAAGSSTATLTVDPTADTTVETDETVALTLATAPTYTIGTTTAVTGTITNDDSSALPVISVAATDANAAETAIGITANPGQFTLTRLGGNINQAVTVNYTLTGTATNGTDYTSLPTSVTFAAGSSTAIVTVTPTNDTIFEVTETAILTLATGTGYTVGTTNNAATVNIADNDPQPTINLSANQTIVEGNTNPQNVSYTVTLSNASSQTITVQYATANGTAIAGSDYTSTSGTLTFNPGVTSQVINIPILNDSLNEADETFTLNLTTATNATLGTAKTATTTITDTLSASVTTTLPGGVENLTLTGTAAINGTGNGGDNVLQGNSANNTLTGLDGNDTYRFLATTALGTDTITETTTGGVDNFDFTGTTAGVNVNLGITTSQTVNSNLKLIISANNVIENATGGAGNDRLTGNGLNNTLNGGSGQIGRAHV